MFELLPRPAAFFRSVCAAALLAAAGPAAAWQTAHGNPDNSGAVAVATAPANTPLPNPPQLGRMAVGAGPVIASDGTVYVANSRGKLMAFRPDGTPLWSRDLPRQSVLSSPALGSDGSVYVIGAAIVRDNTTNPPTTTNVAELHKFTPTGGISWRVPLPGAQGGLTTNAPPNVWTRNGDDVIFVPTVRKLAGFQARLTAFSETGPILADQIVKNYVPEATGGGGKWYHVFAFMNVCYWIDICDFKPPLAAQGSGDDLLPSPLIAPLPAVAIHSAPGSGTPLVIMSDGFQDLVGYAFTGNSFSERFRVHPDKGFLTSTPLAWPDGHAMIGTGGGGSPSQAMFAGFGMTTLRAQGPLTWAAPTALGNSRYALVRRYGGLTVMRGAPIESQVKLSGHSIAPAAASSTHVYVSTASALVTFNKATMTAIAAYGWKRGGMSHVAIGPKGHVYAIADDRLYVFPPPLAVQAAGTPVIDGGVYNDSGAPAPAPATPQSTSFNPPLTVAGNRLFACEKLDGDDCGKGDHRTVATAFCAKSGYAAAQQFDVDSRKVKAETLDGRYCSKKKCKVFEEITCRK